MNAVFDTCILIDYLRGIKAAQAEFQRYDHAAISVITWIEVMVGTPHDVWDATKRFLEGFALVPVDEPVAERAVKLRQTYRIKVPDAIVWASADARGMLLVSRDSKAYPGDHPGIRIPYQV